MREFYIIFWWIVPSENSTIVCEELTPNAPVFLFQWKLVARNPVVTVSRTGQSCKDRWISRKHNRFCPCRVEYSQTRLWGCFVHFILAQTASSPPVVITSQMLNICQLVCAHYAAIFFTCVYINFIYVCFTC